MKAIAEMSNEEILRAIDICMDTGTNFTSHGQSDDYMVGNMQIIKAYQMELKSREQKLCKGEIKLA